MTKGRRRRWATAMLAAAVALQPAWPQSDPLLDMLNNRGYDRDAILREYDNIGAEETPPLNDDGTPDSATSQANDGAAPDAPPETADEATNEAADNTTDGATPLFRPLTPTVREQDGGGNLSALTGLALVLPMDATGLAASIGRRFHEGCVQGLRGVGASIQVDVYVSDGSTASALAAYRQAVSDGANFIIGPLQKKSVAALLEAQPRAPTPTLLLQPGNGENYHVLTMDVDEELGELARFLQTRSDDAPVLLVSGASATSRRQAAAFNDAWNGDDAFSRFHVYEPDKDWERLFTQLKQEAEQEEDDTVQWIVVAAGDAGFVRQTRNFTPQEYPVYAASAFFGGEQGTNAAFLENLRILEMPWFVAADGAADFETPFIRTYPVLHQRFYALGVDACRTAQLSFLWGDGWRFSGVSGELQLRQNTFQRRGVPAKYQGGYLRPLASE